MSESLQSLSTTGAIARRAGEPIHRVQYVVRTRHIKPVAVAGNLRVFSEAQVQRIESELRRIAADRRGDER